MEALKSFIWNYMFVPLFLITGVICILNMIKNGKADYKKGDGKGEVSPIQALWVNLASTIGTGNIIGVALAIGVGGAGSVFWMWIAAIFGMVISYTENAMGIKWKEKNDRPIGYMGRRTAVIFSILCIISSFGIGNMVQSNSAAEALFNGFGMEKWISGVIIAIPVFIIIRGGLKGITKFTDFFVPIMSIFYILAALAVIWINKSRIPYVFGMIFEEAFSIKAIAGGTLAVGMARGVMSGEAGVGSSVILTKKSNAKSPHEQGIVGAMSIFIDTIVICTMTALAILSSDAASTQGAFYSTLGSVGGMILDVAISFFAFTTVVGWSYFGLECTRYLFGEKRINIYIAVYAFMTFLGAILSLEFVWAVGDISCALMALPNLLSLIQKIRLLK